MWLLDANPDIHLLELLRTFEIECDTAENRGWKALRNGELVAAAFQAGFETLVTRDRLFAESAARARRSYPALSVVVVTLPQTSSARYLFAFQAAWKAAPIHPEPGKIIIWPG